MLFRSDSIVLLNLLSKIESVELCVAHVDHGIRTNSAEDEKFVRKVAENYGLPFLSTKLNLGQNASEALARKERYAFLRKIQNSCNAKAIVTAHHQDDLIETILINLVRGTNRRGLSPLYNHYDIERPLLNYRKAEIYKFAKKNGLLWREDHTNFETKYLRNYLRLKVIPKLENNEREKLLNISRKSYEDNREIEDIINNLLPNVDVVDRIFFKSLPHNVSVEAVAYLLRNLSVPIEKNTLEKICLKMKTAKANTRIDISRGKQLIIDEKTIRIIDSSSV